jgi:hypothetical protein
MKRRSFSGLGFNLHDATVLPGNNVNHRGAKTLAFALTFCLVENSG